MRIITPQELNIEGQQGVEDGGFIIVVFNINEGQIHITGSDLEPDEDIQIIEKFLVEQTGIETIIWDE